MSEWDKYLEADFGPKPTGKSPSEALPAGAPAPKGPAPGIDTGTPLTSPRTPGVEYNVREMSPEFGEEVDFKVRKALEREEAKNGPWQRPEVPEGESPVGALGEPDTFLRQYPSVELSAHQAGMVGKEPGQLLSPSHQPLREMTDKEFYEKLLADEDGLAKRMEWVARNDSLSAEQRANVLRLSVGLALPPEVVAGDIPKAQAAWDASQTNWQKVVYDHPALAAVLQQSADHASALRGDVEPLSRLEKKYGSWGDIPQSVVEGWTSQGASMPRGVGLAFKHIMGISNPALDAELEKLKKLEESQTTEFAPGLVGWLQGVPQGSAGAIAQMWQAYIQNPTTVQAGFLAGMTAGALAGSATGPGALGTGLAGGILGAGIAYGGQSAWFNGLAEAGHAYERFIKLPGVTHEEARAAAIYVGAMNGMLEGLEFAIFGKVWRSLGLGKLMPKALLGRATSDTMEQLLRKESGRAAILRLAKNLVDVGLINGVQEAAQEFIPAYEQIRLTQTSDESGSYDALKKLLSGTDPYTGEPYTSAIWDSFKGGTQMVGTYLLPFSMAPHVRQMIAARQATRRQDFFNELKEVSDAIKTREINPALVSDSVQKVIIGSGGAVTEVTYPAQRLQEFFQKAGWTADDLAKKLPDIKRQLDEAAARKDAEMEIKVPVGDVAAYLAKPEAYLELHQDARIGNNPTAREAQKFNEQITKIQEEMGVEEVRAALLPEPSKKVYDHVLQQGMAIDKQKGREFSETYWRKMAMLWVAFSETRAAETGAADAWDYYKGRLTISAAGATQTELRPQKAVQVVAVPAGQTVTVAPGDANLTAAPAAVPVTAAPAQAPPGEQKVAPAVAGTTAGGERLTPELKATLDHAREVYGDTVTAKIEETRAGPAYVLEAKGPEGEPVRLTGTSWRAVRQKLPSRSVARGAISEDVVKGKEAKLVTQEFPRGEPVLYGVIEADQAHASHEPGSFMPNPVYPPGVQERLYHSDVGEQMKVVQGAANLDPAMVLSDDPGAVGGPPMVTGDAKHIALGGNARLMMLKRAAAQHPEQFAAYRRELLKRASAFGLDAAKIEGMTNPILVRVMPGLTSTHPQSDLQAAVRRTNTAMMQALSPLARGFAEARQLTPEAMTSIGQLLTTNEDWTIRDLMRERPVELTQILESAGIITDQNRTEWVVDKEFTDEAKERIEGMFVGRVMGDPVRVKQTAPSMMKKIERVVSYLVRVDTLNPSMSEITALQDALDIMSQARKAQLPPEQFVNQTGMFGGKAFTAPALAMLKLLGEKQTKVVEAFKEWALYAGLDPSQGSLFQEPPRAEKARATLYGTTEQEWRGLELHQAVREQLANENLGTESPGFYSNAARALESVKQAKAKASDWWNIVSKAPGVKLEELEWLQLKEWLDSQKGSLTREEVLAYVQQNELKVYEKILGAPPSESGGISEINQVWLDGLSEELLRAGLELDVAWSEDGPDLSIRDSSGKWHTIIDAHLSVAGSPLPDGLDVRKLTPHQRDIIHWLYRFQFKEIPRRLARFVAGWEQARHWSNEFPVEIDDNPVIGATPAYSAATQALARAAIDTYQLYGGESPANGIVIGDGHLERAANELEIAAHDATVDGDDATASILVNAANLVSMGKWDNWRGHHLRIWNGLLGGPITPEPQYKQYTTEEGRAAEKDSYRELLLYANKGATNWRAPHFGAPLNNRLLAHIRFNVQRDEQTGQPVLYIEEIQSDLHQEGRYRGYSKLTPEEREAKRSETRRTILGGYRTLLGLFGADSSTFQASISSEGLAVAASVRLEDKGRNFIRNFYRRMLEKDSELWRRVADAQDFDPMSEIAARFAGTSEQPWAGELKALARGLPGNKLAPYWQQAWRDAMTEALRSEEFGSAWSHGLELVRESSDEATQTMLRMVTGDFENLLAAAPTDVQMALDADRVRVTQQSIDILSADIDRFNEVIPDAPFKGTTWEELAFKRVLTYAVQHGIGAVGWTTAQEQSQRYDQDESEGFQLAYDKRLPKYAQKLVGKFGGVVEKRALKKEDARTVALLVGQQVFHPQNRDEAIEAAQEAGLSEADVKEVKGRESWLVQLPTPFVQNVTKEGFTLYQQTQEGKSKKSKEPAGRFTMEGVPLDFGPIFKITLEGKADLSTFLHESAHAFLEMLKWESQAGHPKSVELLNTVRSWLQLGEGQEITGDHHEQFASAFEQYLWEGAAPSARMRGVMQTFKAFLRHVYATLAQVWRQTPQRELTDDVREVFDRLLATDEEIQARAKDNFLLPLFENVKGEGLSGEIYAKAKELWDKAVNKVYDEVELQALRDARRAFRADKAAIEAEVRRKFLNGTDQESSIFQAQAIFEGVLADPEGVLPVGARLDGSKLSGYSLSKRELRRLGRFLAVEATAEEARVDPEVAARRFGFKTGEEFLKNLANRPRMEDAIRVGVDDELADRYPGYAMRPAWLEQNVLEALHGNEIGEALEYELRVLGKVLGTSEGRMLTVIRQLKEAARRDVLRISWQAMDQDLWRRQAARKAREAQQLYAKGDVQGAYAAKTHQIYYRAKYEEVVKARAEIEQMVSAMRRMVDRNFLRKLGKAGMHYVNALLRLLNGVQLTGMSLAAVDRRQSLRDFVAEQEAEGRVVTIPKELLDEAKLKHYKEMTLEELRALHGSAEEIAALGLLKANLYLAGKRREFARVRDLVVGEIQKNRPVQTRAGPGISYEQNLLDKIKDGAYWIDASLKKMEFMVREMDGGKTAGPLHFVFIHPLALCENKEARLTDDIHSKLAESVRKYSFREKLRMMRSVDFLGVPMKLSTVLAMAHNAGARENMVKLVEGMNLHTKLNWTVEAVLARLDQLLTKKDWDFVQHNLKVIGSLWNDIKETHRRMKGEYPAEVQAMPIVTQHGVYEGGYFPLIPDAEFYEATDKQREAHASAVALGEAPLFDRGFLTPEPSHPFTHDRTKAVYRLSFELDNIVTHVQDVIHYLSYVETLSSLDRLVRDPEVKSTIWNHMGRAVYKELYPWLRAIANDNKSLEPLRWYGRFFQHLRLGGSIVLLAGKLAIGVQQWLGLFPSVHFLGDNTAERLKYAAIGVREFMGRLAQGHAWKFMYEQSEQMRDMKRHWDRDIRQLYKSMMSTTSELKYAQEKIATFGLAWFWLNQGSVNAVTWYGAYARAKDMGHANPVAFADSTVRLAQSAGSVRDLAAIQRSNEFFKLFTVMYGYFSAMYGGMTERRPAGMSKGQFIVAMASRFWWILLLPTVIGMMLRGTAPKGGDDDDPWEWTKLVGGETTKYAFRAVPIVTDAVNIVVDKKMPRGNPYLEMFFKGILAGAKGGQMWLDPDDERELTTPQMKALINFAGLMGHVPSQAGINAYEWMLTLPDQEEPIQNLLFRSKRDFK